MVVLMPRRTNASAISRPIKPPPAMTAVFGFFSSTQACMRSMSGTVQRRKTLGESTPGSRGTTGAPPCARISES